MKRLYGSVLLFCLCTWARVGAAPAPESDDTNPEWPSSIFLDDCRKPQEVFKALDGTPSVIKETLKTLESPDEDDETAINYFFKNPNSDQTAQLQKTYERLGDITPSDPGKLKVYCHAEKHPMASVKDACSTTTAFVQSLIQKKANEDEMSDEDADTIYLCPGWWRATGNFPTPLDQPRSENFFKKSIWRAYENARSVTLLHEQTHRKGVVSGVFKTKRTFQLNINGQEKTFTKEIPSAGDFGYGYSCRPGRKNIFTAVEDADHAITNADTLALFAVVAARKRLYGVKPEFKVDDDGKPICLV